LGGQGARAVDVDHRGDHTDSLISVRRDHQAPVVLREIDIDRTSLMIIEQDRRDERRTSSLLREQ